MNVLKLGFLVLFCLFSTLCTGQDCKYPKKMHKKAQKHFEGEKIIKATKPKTMFSKFSTAASTNFVKSDNGYYLGLILVREFGSRIDLMDDNPLMFQFKNDSLLTLYPDRSMPGKFSLPVTTEMNRAYYKASADQLELLAAHPIVHIKVYFTSNAKDASSMNNGNVDDLGTFLDFEIIKENFQFNCIESANCILQ